MERSGEGGLDKAQTKRHVDTRTEGSERMIGLEQFVPSASVRKHEILENLTQADVELRRRKHDGCTVCFAH
jgi:hypothetical protein